MSDLDDYELERFAALLEAFSEMCERQMQAEFERIAERYEQEAPPHPFPYQPNTEHPAYASQAKLVRHFVAEGRHAVVLPVPLSRRAMFMSPDEYPTEPSFERRILDVKRAAGRAPYVGEPFIYIWDVAVDEMGRWVAGPTRIHPIGRDGS